MTRRALLIFLRYPTPGRVKTRLAKTLTAASAASLYRSFVETIVAQTRGSWQQILFMSPPERARDARAWLGEGLVLPQRGGDLGARMAQAFGLVFKRGYQKAVLIGTDSPLIDARRIRLAFRALDHARAVLGPSEDGGYYLIGATRFYPGLFKGIAWGDGTVLSSTLDCLHHLDISFQLLPEEYDVDRPEDVGRLLSDLRGLKRLPASLRRVLGLLESTVGTFSKRERLH